MREEVPVSFCWKRRQVVNLQKTHMKFLSFISNSFGHADEFAAATMVIVLISIIVMGGATESLLRALKIDMNVDEEEYMKDWRKKRELKGWFHRFGTLLLLMNYLYDLCNLTFFLHTLRFPGTLFALSEYRYIFCIVVRDPPTIEGCCSEDEFSVQTASTFDYHAKDAAVSSKTRS